MSGSLGQEAPPSAAQHLPALAGGLDLRTAHFQATAKVMNNIEQFKDGLGSLLKKGDTVGPEDVIEAAGKLVASGQDPSMMASLLADMPESGGEALQGWLQSHVAALGQQEAQVAQAHQQTRHAMGVSAIHNLMAHSMNPASQAPALAPQSTSNALGTGA